MLREKYGLPPMSPEEQIERLIRDEMDAQPVRKHWDRSTTYLLIGALGVMCGFAYMLGVTLPDIWASIAQLFNDLPAMITGQPL